MFQAVPSAAVLSRIFAMAKVHGYGMVHSHVSPADKYMTDFP